MCHRSGRHGEDKEFKGSKFCIAEEKCLKRSTFKEDLPRKRRRALEDLRSWLHLGEKVMALREAPK